MSITDITVVITSFKSGNKIKNCLGSIDPGCQIIVVENSNDFEFKKNLENEFTNVRCILTGDNFGYGKANNIGLEKVKTKYALILNPDVVLQDSTLKLFLETAKQKPNFAIIAPTLKEDIKTEIQLDKINLSPKLVENVKGHAMLLNLSEFNDIGYFDENFFFFFEEIDLCKRLIKSKKKIFSVPEIKITHLGGQSHDESINKEMELSRNWHWMWSTFNYHKKYKGFFISFFIVFPKLISAIFKFLFYSLTSNDEKKRIYHHRYSGLINAIIGKSSWYRPKV